jgi:hypothetical protein
MQAAGNTTIVTLPNRGECPSGIMPTLRCYAEDLCDPRVEHFGPSQITATPQPGIGVEQHPERLARWTVDRFS